MKSLKNINIPKTLYVLSLSIMYIGSVFLLYGMLGLSFYYAPEQHFFNDYFSLDLSFLSMIFGVDNKIRAN